MAANVAKTLARIKGTVESGAYYEAQQMYKTSYHRCKSRGQVMESYQILQEGAVTQLTHGQVTCGVELGTLLVEAYAAGGVPPGVTAVENLLSIVNAFPPPDKQQGAAGSAASAAATAGPNSPSVDECARFVTAAVKWAQKNGTADAPRPLHAAFARYLWRSFGPLGLGRALPHFVRGDDPNTFAQALHTCSRDGPASEVDLWLLRGVLQVLSAARTQTRILHTLLARGLHDAFVSLGGGGGGGGLDTPTAHFTELMLQSVEHIPHPRALDMWRLLRDRYGQSVLRRDESLGAMADTVEAVFFGVRRGGGDGPLGGLLGGLLKSLTEAA